MDISVKRHSEISEFLTRTKKVVSEKRGTKGRSLEALYALSVGLKSDEYLLMRAKMNDVFDVDALLREVNDLLEERQYFIGCANFLGGYETAVFQRGMFLPKMGLRQLAFLFHRVIPKMSWGNRAYTFLMRGRSKRMSKTEILGRLVYAGFSIDQVETEGVMLYYRVKKSSAPLKGHSPSYGPLIKLKRMGKGGKQIYMYKFRTMYPYAEFIQEYVYEQNELDVGGKIKNDFRVSEEGSLFRKFFLDEIPMLINLLKGDIKLVGVRPLSAHYFSLYTAEMRRRRIRVKPGLLPPYYSEKKKPETLEEIMVSEMRYILQHERQPFITDVKYFFKIWRNILFKNQRSK